MSLSNDYSPADLQACTCGNGYGNGGDGWGGGWASWIIIFLIFAIFGWGGNGFGTGGFGGGGGVMDGYVLSSDFSNIERKIDGVNNGLCDGFYAVNTSFGNLNNTLAQNTASIQNTLTQGFAGLNTGMIQQGYENRIATGEVSRQLADCCCDIKGQIKDNTTQGIFNTNAIQTQIQQCCCDNEKQVMDLKYTLATQNCATLQAIDKVGDRIIDYMACEKTQALRDENQALRLAASQAAQNNYLINALNPPPVPSYSVPNPYTGRSGCGCGYGC